MMLVTGELTKKPLKVSMLKAGVAGELKHLCCGCERLTDWEEVTGCADLSILI